MKKQAVVLAGLMLWGCGGDEPTPVVQTPDAVTPATPEPAKPLGTVSGMVLTVQGAPLEGATVTLTVGSAPTSRTATTDAAGTFRFQEVPGAAQVLLTFGKPGYATLRASATVPSSAGNSPVDNGNASFGPVVLGAANGVVKVQLVAPDGRPAAGARASLVARNAAILDSNLSGGARANLVVEATADATGTLTFSGTTPAEDLLLLNGDYQLSVPAWDANADGVFEAAGLVRGYGAGEVLAWGGPHVERLQSAYSTANLGLVSSTLASLAGGPLNPLNNLLAPDASAQLLFNQPVQPDSVRVDLTDEYGAASLGARWTLSVGDTQLAFTPDFTVLPGREYQVRVRAVGLNGTLFTRTGLLVGGTADVAPALSLAEVRWQEVGSNNGLVDTGENVSLIFNQVLTARLTLSTAYVFLGADLNNSGVIGDGQGERDPLTGRMLSPSAGFSLQAAEPTAPVATRTPAETPVFPLVTNGYSTRWRFMYGGNASLNPAAGVKVTVLFSALNPNTDAYETGWGVVQAADLTFQTSTMTPYAVPTP